MSPDLSRWFLALIAAIIVAAIARSRRSLSPGGTLAAIAMGTILVGAAGWWAGLLLVTFFASSSLLSKVNARSAIEQTRGAERDAVQVFANGGIALSAAISWALLDSPAAIIAMAGAIAAANADTWSTEIGRTSRSLPRLVTTGRHVPAGTSGAVSRRGLAGAIAGGALIGLLAGIGWATGWLPGETSVPIGIGAVTIAGLIGSLMDSLLGATVQHQRWCDVCAKGTEQRIHRCGAQTRGIRGAAWIDNDVVNFLCGGTGAVIAVLLTMSA